MAKRRKPQPFVRGKSETIDLTTLQPNSWNGNVMTETERESTKAGFLKEGWLASQGMTVWRTDETGKERRVIIDGEQRWRCALEVGLLEGPGVYLDGITEAEARALTVKLYRRRGSWTDEGLAAALQPMALDAGDALDLGFDEEHFAQLLKLEIAPEPDKSREQNERRRKQDAVQRQFAIVIECVGEEDQLEKLRELGKLGWPCRALI